MDKFSNYRLGLSDDLLVWGLFIDWLAVTEIAWFSVVFR
jgi:hypothetical protein